MMDEATRKKLVKETERVAKGLSRTFLYEFFLFRETPMLTPRERGGSGVVLLTDEQFFEYDRRLRELAQAARSAFVEHVQPFVTMAQDIRDEIKRKHGWKK